MKPIRNLLAASAILFLLGCSSPDIHYDYDAGNNFSNYHSFAWEMAPAGQPRTSGFDNALEEGRVHRAVVAELVSRGFILAVSGTPDFLVSYHPIWEGDRSPHVGLGIGIGLGPLGIGLGAPLGHHGPQAGIVIEMQDFRSLSLIWKATAEGALQGSDSPEEAESNIKDAVHSMLKRFPPT